jgi:hypothetical protein
MGDMLVPLHKSLFLSIRCLLVFFWVLHFGVKKNQTLELALRMVFDVSFLSQLFVIDFAELLFEHLFTPCSECLGFLLFFS